MQEQAKIRTEEDLYIPVRDYLIGHGYTVRSEVSHCDVTAIDQAGTLLVIEMKLRVNLDVILQAALRQRIADIVYIAVPKNNKSLHTAKWKSICHLLKRLEIGLLLVACRNKSLSVEEALQPVPFNRETSRNLAARKKKKLLEEFAGRKGDFNTGGSSGKKLVTAYKEMAIHIAALLAQHGPLAVKQLKQYGTDREKTGRILLDNHYNWFQKIARGVYAINDTGVMALNNYKEIANCYIGSPEITE